VLENCPPNLAFCVCDNKVNQNQEGVTMMRSTSLFSQLLSLFDRAKATLTSGIWTAEMN